MKPEIKHIIFPDGIKMIDEPLVDNELPDIPSDCDCALKILGIHKTSCARLGIMYMRQITLTYENLDHSILTRKGGYFANTALDWTPDNIYKQALTDFKIEILRCVASA